MGRRFALAGVAVASSMAVACSGVDHGGPANKGLDAEGPNLGTWETLPPMPDPPRFYLGAAAVGGRVFVLGGNLAPESTLAQAFDTTTRTWQTLDPLPSPYTMPSVAVVGDRLFVLGGLSSPKTI